MFGKTRRKDDSSNFSSHNYKMKDNYNTGNLVVANLKYISSEATPGGPVVRETLQKYIFELVKKNEKIRYREIFTGFIADSHENGYFDLPYVINIRPLKEEVPSVANHIAKYGLLLVLNEVNGKRNTKRLKKTIVG